MVLCSTAPSTPVWSVHKPVEVPSVPLPLSSDSPQLSNPSPRQPSTPSFPSMSPLSFSNTTTTAATDQQWAQPTISTFSTSTPLHIVQPYLQNQSDSANPVKESGLLPSDVLNHSAIRPRRPANAWILYRSDKMKILKPTEPSAPRRTQADVSKLIAEMWRNETEEVKKYYETLSDLAKAEHHAQYPTYRFQPAKKTEKPRGQKKARKAQLRAERGTNAQRVVSSTFTPLQERSANSVLERHSIDDTQPSQRPLYSQKTVPPFPFASVFVPYQVPLRPRSFTTSETKRSTRPHSSEESQALRPSLPSLVTTLSTSPTTPLMPSEAVSLETSTRFLHRWPEQSTPLTTTIQYNAHSDHSHVYNSPITVCLLYSTPTTGRSLTNPLQTDHEQSSRAPTGWIPSNTSYEYPFDPAQSTGPRSLPTESQSLSRISSDPYTNLFTHPGASFEAALPDDFHFNAPEMGEFDAFEQWFGPGGLDIAGYPTFSDPTSFQQPSHQLPHNAAGGHGLTKRKSSTGPLLQSSSKRGALAYPTPPPSSPPTTVIPSTVPYGFSQVASLQKTEHYGLGPSPPPATCHYIGHQQEWDSYHPIAPA